jgi:hypothetical protein
MLINSEFCIYSFISFFNLFYHQTFLCARVIYFDAKFYNYAVINGLLCKR